MLQTQVLTLVHFCGANERLIADRIFNGRILQARQCLQCLLWSGIIFGDANSGYTLTPIAKSNLEAAYTAVNYQNFCTHATYTWTHE